MFLLVCSSIRNRYNIVCLQIVESILYVIAFMYERVQSHYPGRAYVRKSTVCRDQCQQRPTQCRAKAFLSPSLQRTFVTSMRMPLKVSYSSLYKKFNNSAQYGPIMESWIGLAALYIWRIPIWVRVLCKKSLNNLVRLHKMFSVRCGAQQDLINGIHVNFPERTILGGAIEDLLQYPQKLSLLYKLVKAHIA